ncbi:MAG: molybdate ABC transporter substrate-binding protein [Solirubrobacteraceae bacterium]
MLRRHPIVILTAAVALLAAGCASSSSSSASGSASGQTAARPTLIVSAAASLHAAFTKYGGQFPLAKSQFSFAGSDMLAAQIEQGARPDVFASANAKLPDALYAQGLVGKPVTFAANRLVLAVPASSKITSLAGVQKPGVTLVIGSASVPIGIYTRKVLAKLGSAQSAKILANVRSNEPDVSSIVGKLTQGAADAGFTYVTDVKATGGKLKAIALPASLQPVVAYGVAVVKSSAHQAQADKFIAGLLSGAGQTDLTQAGFLAPPAT